MSTIFDEPKWRYFAPAELSSRLRYIYNCAEKNPNMGVRRGVAHELIHLAEASKPTDPNRLTGPRVPDPIRQTLTLAETAHDLCAALDDFCQWAQQVRISIYHAPRAEAD